MMKAIVTLALVPSAAVVLAMNAGDRPDAKESAKEEGLALFAKTMPVFSSPRCINCHGAVDPISGDNHGGGPIEGVALNEAGVLVSNAKCLECHTAAHFPDDESSGVHDTLRWRLPPPGARYAGKSVVQVCEQMKDWAEVMDRDPTNMLLHLQSDPLIVWGFEGRAAGARDPDPPAPPAMTQEEFIAAFAAWEKDGASCDPPATWTGTITIERTQKYDTTKDFGRGGGAIREHTRITGTQRYDIVVRADTAFASVSGAALSEYVRTLVNPSPGHCGFGESRKAERTRYYGTPRKRVSLKIDPQPGVTNGFLIKFPLPPYYADHAKDEEWKNPSCKGLDPRSKTSTRTDTISNKTNDMLLVGNAIELTGLDGKVMGEIMQGERETKTSDRTIMVRWDMARGQ